MLPLEEVPWNALNLEQEGSSWSWLAGDASDRKFFRLLHPQKTVVAMFFGSWQGGYGGSPEDWLEVRTLFEKYGLRVPQVLSVDQKNAVIYIEDFKDDFLYHYGMRGESLEKFYKKTIDDLLLLQYPLEKFQKNRAYMRAFDFEKLFFEMDFFMTHFLGHFLGILDSSPLKAEFQKLCLYLASRPRVLCHRDCMSKNVMIFEHQISWIDFQDARVGPHTYDLASLLRDSYISLEDDFKKSLFEYYLEKVEIHIKSKEEFKILPKEMEYMSLQRNIKALGSFGFLATSKQKYGYLAHVKRTLSHLRKIGIFGQVSLEKEYPHVFSFLKELEEGRLRDLLDQKLKLYGEGEK